MPSPMMRIGFDVVAFDLDGTLADTGADLAASLNHMLKRLGRSTLPPDSVRHLVGHGTGALVRRGLAATGPVSEDLVERGYSIFLDHYSDNICNRTTAYPGIEPALDALARQGIALSICTNKPEALTLRLVEALSWNGRFNAVIGGDSLPVRKPDAAPLHEVIARAGGGRAAFVGDSIIDADTARAADIPFIAVSFGFSDRPSERLGADIVIDSYDELLPALARL